MFELANRLVGIYKTSDCTRSVTVDPEKFAAPLQESSAAARDARAAVARKVTSVDAGKKENAVHK